MLLGSREKLLEDKGRLLHPSRTGHAEVVRVIFDPEQVDYSTLLKSFWENHNPTTKDRQGNDSGPMYRSAIYCDDEAQLELAKKSAETYQQNLNARGITGEITTEIKLDKVFYYAEDYHQQYLHKNPGGYCSMRGTGVKCTLWSTDLAFREYSGVYSREINNLGTENSGILDIMNTPIEAKWEPQPLIPYEQGYSGPLSHMSTKSTVPIT